MCSVQNVSCTRSHLITPAALLQDRSVIKLSLWPWDYMSSDLCFFFKKVSCGFPNWKCTRQYKNCSPKSLVINHSPTCFVQGVKLSCTCGLFPWSIISLLRCLLAYRAEILDIFSVAHSRKNQFWLTLFEPSRSQFLFIHIHRSGLSDTTSLGNLSLRWCFPDFNLYSQMGLWNHRSSFGKIR